MMNDNNDFNASNSKTEINELNHNSVSNNKKRIAKNYVFNVLYQVFLIVIPLVLTPYISRILTPYGVGKYSFSLSLITYFTLFAAFGFNTYGQREISKWQNNKEQQSKIFFEIVIARLLFVFASLSVNITFFLFNVYGHYSQLMIIMSLNIVAIAFDISFFFQGNEQFGKLVLRNVIIKLLGLASIFIFVKNENDVWLYTLINSLVILLTNLYLLILLPKNIVKIRIQDLDIKTAIKKAFFLFIPSIVISIYTVMDRTMLGLIIKNDAEIGYYDQAEKLIKMSVVIITCLGIVMIPRNSAEYSKNNFEQVKNNVYFAIKFCWLIGIPLMFGIMAISKNLNSWFFGDGYEPVILLMIVFSPLIIAIGLSNVLGVQYLIPTGNDKIFTFSVLFGAGVNVVLNTILLFTIGTIGAVIGSVVAEISVFVFQLVYLRKVFSIKRVLFCGRKNVIAGLIMFLSLYFISQYLESKIINTIILIVIGVVIYGVLVILFRDELVLIVLRKVFKRKKL